MNRLSALLLLLALPACVGGLRPGQGGGDEDPNATPELIPGGDYCQAVSGWSEEWSAMEAQVLELVNGHRATGYDCDTEGVFGTARPLTMNASLRCAARNHSVDMDERSFFDHVNPDGERPWDRVEQTPYGSWVTIGENIAAGATTPEVVVGGWMNSDGHCSNIMASSFQEIGVGYWSGGNVYWTQVFAEHF